MTIRRSERDALWHLCGAVLARINDIYNAFDVGAVDEARALRRRFDDVMRILDDIGWAEGQSGEQFALTLDPDRLLHALLRVHEAGVELVSDHYTEGIDREPKALQDAVIGLAACDTLMIRLAYSAGDRTVGRVPLSS